MKSKEVIEEFNKHIMPTYGRFDVLIEEGKERKCKDIDGNSYIDFGSGIGTNSLGYCDDRWVDMVCSQVAKMQHTSNYYYTKIQANFASKLCEMTDYSKIFFANSGAEANECAIKLARKYSFDKYGKNRHKILTLVNSFHGRTLCTLSATGQDSFHNYFFPFVEGFEYVVANDIEDLKSKIDDSICAIMFEFIQGEGGVISLNQDFIDEIFNIAKQKDILTIADEVQTGMGRTGEVLASQHFKVKANITTLAKGLAGGLPIGVCLADEKCADVLGKSTHGSTFGGNPISCAGGLAVLERLQKDGFLDEIKQKAKYFKKELEKIEEIDSIDGKGLMIGA
ncbi:MAG: aspartate aminotransferase family protein, partial [Clostridiales bacterium]